jgi:hypothetical protein
MKQIKIMYIVICWFGSVVDIFNDDLFFQLEGLGKQGQDFGSRGFRRGGNFTEEVFGGW